MDKKHRLFLLDIMRVTCAIMIFLRHSISMFGCTYGYRLDEFFYKMTSPVMTCFFILSGFSIHYQHRTEKVSSVWMRVFLKKRLIAIMPSYLLVVIIWPVFYLDQIKNWAVLIPIELLGVQTSFHSLFGILHNGGTWFVSCLLIAYAMYPVIKSILESGNRWNPIIMMLLTHFVLAYSSFIVSSFSLESLYSNPIARTAEFMIGASFAEILINQLYGAKKVGCVIMFSLFIATMIASLAHATAKEVVFVFLVIPSILLLLFVACLVRSVKLEHSKHLLTLSSMSYQFFLVQLFLWKLSKRVLGIVHLENNNFARIGISFILCISISFLVWRFYDKPIKQQLRKQLKIY